MRSRKNISQLRRTQRFGNGILRHPGESAPYESRRNTYWRKYNSTKQSKAFPFSLVNPSTGANDYGIISRHAWSNRWILAEISLMKSRAIPLRFRFRDGNGFLGQSLSCSPHEISVSESLKHNRHNCFHCRKLIFFYFGKHFGIYDSSFLVCGAFCVQRLLTSKWFSRILIDDLDFMTEDCRSFDHIDTFLERSSKNWPTFSPWSLFHQIILKVCLPQFNSYWFI